MSGISNPFDKDWSPDGRTGRVHGADKDLKMKVVLSQPRIGDAAGGRGRSEAGRRIRGHWYAVIRDRSGGKSPVVFGFRRAYKTSQRCCLFREAIQLVTTQLGKTISFLQHNNVHETHNHLANLLAFQDHP